MASGFTVSTTFTARGNLERKLGHIKREVGQVGVFASRAKRAIAGVTKGAAIGGAAALAYGIREVGREFVDLDSAITNASSKWGPAFDRGTDGFNDLMEAAKRVGLTTEHQSAQAADGLSSPPESPVLPSVALDFGPQPLTSAAATTRDRDRDRDRERWGRMTSIYHVGGGDGGDTRDSTPRGHRLPQDGSCIVSRRAARPVATPLDLRRDPVLRPCMVARACPCAPFPVA